MSEYDETHDVKRKPAGSAGSVGGRFDNRDRLDADGSVTLEYPFAQEQALDDPDEFDWERIDSLMGQDFHLDAERTAALPKMKPTDTIAQMTSKVMNYVARTQDLDGLTDEQIVEIMGLAPTSGDVSRIRSMHGLGAGARIVAGVDGEGKVWYLSPDNDFKRTGSFSPRYGGASYHVANVAQRLVASRYRERFSAEHPEFDETTIDSLFRRLEDKELRGKGWAHLWQETVLPAREMKVACAGALRGLAIDTAKVTPEEVAFKLLRMSADEARAGLAALETEDQTIYDRQRGVHEEPAYVARVRGMKLYANAASCEAHLAGESDYAKRASVNRAYRAFLEEELAVEYDYELQRKYVRDHNASHTATVFEEKKNIPFSHLEAAENGYFHTSGDFSHVEFDAETDLDKVAHIEDEYAHLRDYLPHTDKTPTLRFRKTGRHHALGIYHPHVDNIAVDPRHPSSFIHEYIHHVDHTAGGRNISSSDEFRPILRAVQAGIASDPSLAKKADYYQTPTEVLSRTAEAYFHWKGVDTSLNGDDAKYADNAAYTTLLPVKDQIVGFWDKQLADLGASKRA